MRIKLAFAAWASLAFCSAASADESKMAKLAAEQAPVMSIDSASIEIPRMPHTIKMIVHAKVSSTGWTNGAILPRIYIQPPKDGIYEVDVVAQKPGGMTGQVIMPMLIDQPWKNYPEPHLKGIKFNAKTNSVTAMLPPVKP